MKMLNLIKPLTVAALLMLALLAAGCGSSDETTETVAKRSDQSSQGTTTETTETAVKEKPVPAAPKSAYKPLEQAAGKQAGRLIIPTGPSPQKVITKTLVAGKGPALEEGDVFEVDYMSYDYKTGRQLEDSWDNYSVPYLLGEGSVVQAWIPGLTGMKVGEIRELIAPASLSYESGPVIFLVKMLDLEKQ
jgi:FKBP-type peptidyl-prolyl cis-trans isomerase